MTKQELLEAIAPYLPYGIKCYGMGEWVEGTEYNDKPTPKMFSIVGIVKDSNEEHYAQCEEDNGDITDVYVVGDLFPILRPLSDLTKNCLEGEKIPIVELAKMCYWNSHCEELDDSLFMCADLTNHYSVCFKPYDAEFELAVSNLAWWFDFTYRANREIMHVETIALLNKLYAWHFDINGLIEKGYAVDINTINQ